MPPTPKWKPWHEVVQLRDELKLGELSLAMFAADLDEVILKKNKRPIYEDPKKFFALTYPTYNLRNLARDVVRRLAGKSDKAVRQLNLTYGGGKSGSLAIKYARAICRLMAGCWCASFLALKIRRAASLSRVRRLSCLPVELF